MTGRTLRPVEQMRREVEAISPADLGKRITAPEGDPDFGGTTAVITLPMDQS